MAAGDKEQYLISAHPSLHLMVVKLNWMLLAWANCRKSMQISANVSKGHLETVHMGDTALQNKAVCQIEAVQGRLSSLVPLSPL